MIQWMTDGAELPDQGANLGGSSSSSYSSVNQTTQEVNEADESQNNTGRTQGAGFSSHTYLAADGAFGYLHQTIDAASDSQSEEGSGSGTKLVDDFGSETNSYSMVKTATFSSSGITLESMKISEDGSYFTVSIENTFIYLTVHSWTAMWSRSWEYKNHLGSVTSTASSSSRDTFTSSSQVTGSYSEYSEWAVTWEPATEARYTVSTEEVSRTYASWTTTNATFSVWTFDGTSLTTTQSEVTWVTSYEASVTYGVKGLGTIVHTIKPNRAERWLYEADECWQLYSAVNIGGVKAFEEAFIPIGRGTVEVNYTTFTQNGTTNSTTASGSASGISTAAGGTTNSSHSSSSATMDFYNEYSYASQSSATGQKGTPVAGGWTLRMPARKAGFQPYWSLGKDDPAYVSYTISVATSCTVASDIALRALGARYTRGAITQVATVNANDTLIMGAVVTGSTTAGGNGGYGYAGGGWSITLRQGVYHITKYNGGGSATYVSTHAATATSSYAIPEGEIWHIETCRAYKPGASSPFLELPC